MAKVTGITRKTMRPARFVAVIEAILRRAGKPMTPENGLRLRGAPALSQVTPRSEADNGFTRKEEKMTPASRQASLSGLVPGNFVASLKPEE